MPRIWGSKGVKIGAVVGKILVGLWDGVSLSSFGGHWNQFTSSAEALQLSSKSLSASANAFALGLKWGSWSLVGFFGLEMIFLGWLSLLAICPHCSPCIVQRPWRKTLATKLGMETLFYVMQWELATAGELLGLVGSCGVFYKCSHFGGLVAVCDSQFQRLLKRSRTVFMPSLHRCIEPPWLLCPTPLPWQPQIGPFSLVVPLVASLGGSPFWCGRLWGLPCTLSGYDGGSGNFLVIHTPN